MTYEHEALTMKKVYRRLVPFLFLLLVINYLDRVNIGFAALRMNHELGLSSTAFGIGAGVFSSATRSSRYRAMPCYTALAHGCGSASS